MNWVNTLKDFGDWVGHLWPFVVAVAAVVAVMRRSFKKLLHEMITNEIKPIQDQFHNNGGSSMKDAVDAVSSKLDKANDKADETNKKVDQTVETVRLHTVSDAENFDTISTNFSSIFSALASVIEGQATAKKAADEAKLELQAEAQRVKDELRAEAERIKLELDDKKN